MYTRICNAISMVGINSGHSSITSLTQKSKEDYLKLVEGFDEANDASVMWEDGDIDEMIRAIDLSPLIDVVEKFAV